MQKPPVNNETGIARPIAQIEMDKRKDGSVKRWNGIEKLGGEKERQKEKHREGNESVKGGRREGGLNLRAKGGGGRV